MTISKHTAIALAVIALFSRQQVLAQTQIDRGETRLDEVNVRAGAQPATDLGTPSSRLSGSGLVLKGSSSLGEMLNGTPGVSSTYFGPVSSRPIVRGMDGDRVRILNNAADNLDVSGDETDWKKYSSG